MTASDMSGILFVISAPSGTGKSTVSRGVLERVGTVEFSVSYTTRSRRDGEQDGADYHFIGRDRFEAMAAGGEFLEWANVFGQLYGTGLAATRKVLDAGRNLLLDIDVQGARQVREHGISCISVMLLPPDYQTLESRLKSRGSESDEKVTQRLARARNEAEDYRYFDYVVVNDDVGRAVSELESIVRAERRRTAYCADLAEKILSTFPKSTEKAKEI